MTLDLAALTAREDLRCAIARSARLLDAQEFMGFAALFEQQGRYRIEVLAPELPVTMIWLDLTREQLEERFEAIPRHEWRDLEQTRQVAVDEITLDGPAARVTSTVSVFLTDDDGRSHLYAIGRYEDDWRNGPDGWRLRERVVALRTRLLSPASPLPL